MKSSLKFAVLAITYFGVILVVILNSEARVQELTIQKVNLSHQLTQAESDYNQYSLAHSHSNDAYDSLQSYLTAYEQTHPYTQQDYDSSWYHFYYDGNIPQKWGANSLPNDLAGLRYTISYQENVFDCSEMTALLERYLENLGWHTLITVGDSPFGTGNNHAWLLVETSQGGYMPVESTTIRMIWGNEPYFDNYFKYDTYYQSIQEAAIAMPGEFDWWTTNGRLVK